MKYLISSFPRSDNEAKCDVDFRHSTIYASKILQEVEKTNVLTAKSEVKKKLHCFDYRCAGGSCITEHAVVGDAILTQTKSATLHIASSTGDF